MELETLLKLPNVLNQLLDLPDLNTLSVSWVSDIARCFPQNICPITSPLVVWYLNVLESVSHHPIQWSENLLHRSPFHRPTLVKSLYVKSKYHFWSKGRLGGCTKHHSAVHLSSRYYKPNKLPNSVERTVRVRMGDDETWISLNWNSQMAIYRPRHFHNWQSTWVEEYGE